MVSKERIGRPLGPQEKGKRIRPKADVQIQLAGIDKRYGAVSGTAEKKTNEGGGIARRKSIALIKALKAYKDDDDGDDDDDDVTYTQLLKRNRPFRLFLWSYIANHMGEWLTYLASISAIEKIQLDSGIVKTSRTAIATLIVVRLAPNIILAPFGGVLADGRDRRESMIVLDMIGAAVAWIFILAIELKSIPMIFLATFLQECVAGMYEPSRSAIIPLLVPEDEGLKQATTLAGLSYSCVAAFGSASGGIMVALFGIRACYFIDSMTYLLSAYLMSQVGGKWSVSRDEPAEATPGTPWVRMSGKVTKSVSYTRTSFFGALVLLKFSSALLYGAIDVLNVSFSERGSDEGRSARLGLLFAIPGIGCMIGPLVADRFTNMTQPKTIQLACVYSFALTVFGLLMMSIYRQFWLIGLFTGIRAMGSAIVWINSSLLLQKFCEPDMFGRLSAIENALALFGEAASALGAGLLQDLGWDAEEVCLLLSVIGVFLASFWAFYHFTGNGAVSYKEVPKTATSTPYTSVHLPALESLPDTEKSSLLRSDSFP